MLKTIFVIFSSVMLFSVSAIAQQVSGTLKQQSGQVIKLIGYKGFASIELATDTLDTKGGFLLNYQNYQGIGYLQTQDEGLLFLILNEPTVEVIGTQLNDIASITTNKSKENTLFKTYSTQHNQREMALAAWKYLLPIYQEDVFATYTRKKKEIASEIKRIEAEDSLFLQKINPNLYASWFLPIRKLIGDMPLTAKQYPERIPLDLGIFRHLDFNDKRLYNSGLLSDLLEGHYLLMENMGQPLDSVYVQMNVSTDYIINQLQGNEKLLNEVGDYLFNFFEKRSLFEASEHLAIQLLTQNSCTLNNNLAQQLETYRAMKVGNTAPNIVFDSLHFVSKNKENKYASLQEMPQDYTLVVFGAGWCPHCTEEIPKLKKYYTQWKQDYNLEIVFVSLDKNETDFTTFAAPFPWYNYCDYKSWKGKTVQNYFIFGTPTLFLLDKNRKILLRPRSVEHVDSWVKFRIIK